MIYHIAEYLDRTFDLPGAGMFNYISFRSAMAIVDSLLIGMVFGKGIIRLLQRHQIG